MYNVRIVKLKQRGQIVGEDVEKLAAQAVNHSWKDFVGIAKSYVSLVERFIKTRDINLVELFPNENKRFLYALNNIDTQVKECEENLKTTEER